MSEVSPDDVPAYGFGIDKLRIVYPSDAAHPENLDHWESSTTWARGPKTFTAKVKHPDGWDLFVRRNAGTREATIEFNPSRVIEPLGWRVWSVERCRRALDVVREFINDARIEIISGAPESGELRRVDVARDFTVEPTAGPAQRFIAALTPLRRPYCHRHLAVWDQGEEQWGQLIVGGKRDQVTLYVKERVDYVFDEPVDEDGSPAPRDMYLKPTPLLPTDDQEMLRFEVRGRKDWLQRAGLSLVSDLTHERVLAFARERWEWSRMGSEITSPDGLLYRIAKTNVLDDGERAAFAGWLAGQQHGIELPTMSRGQARKFQRAAVALGVADDQLLLPARSPKRSDRRTQLDFRLGRARGTTVVRRLSRPGR